VKVHVNEARQHRAARQIDALGARRRRHLPGCAGRDNPIAFDDDAGVLEGRAARPVDQARAVEDDDGGRLRGESGGENSRKEVAHTCPSVGDLAAD
jgi:hypothetical protein